MGEKPHRTKPEDGRGSLSGGSEVRLRCEAVALCLAQVYSLWTWLFG